MLIRARLLLPMVGPPIEDGALMIAGERIAAVGTFRELKQQDSGARLDLGEVAVLPGLINSHCHLDYTGMAGQVLPQKSFADWIKGMFAVKAQWTYSDYAFSWINGARMQLRHGTTTVADIETIPELLPEVWLATPLRVISLMEMTGIRSQKKTETILEEACGHANRVAGCAGRFGLSPHAPYSTRPELLRLAGRRCRANRWPLAIHVAESHEELEMFVYRQGALFDWLKSQRDMSDCGKGSPIQHLHRNELLGPNVLAIHANYLVPGDAPLLARQQVTVVHCPRSHRYFQHQPFPRNELASAGVNISLGTDSLATVRQHPREAAQLNLFDEMRRLASNEPGLAPEMILRMCTVNAARGLGWPGRFGELSPGATADLCVVPFAAMTSQAYPAIVQHTGPVTSTMLDGRWVFGPDL